MRPVKMLCGNSQDGKELSIANNNYSQVYFTKFFQWIIVYMINILIKNILLTGITYGLKSLVLQHLVHVPKSPCVSFSHQLKSYGRR